MRSPTPVREKHLQTFIEPPPCFTVGTTHFGSIFSSSDRRTKTLLFCLNIWKLDSSVHKILDQSSEVQFICVWPQFNLFNRLICLNSGLRTATRPKKFSLRRTLFTVDRDKSFNLPQSKSALISEAVSLLFILLMSWIDCFQRHSLLLACQSFCDHYEIQSLDNVQ